MIVAKPRPIEQLACDGLENMVPRALMETPSEPVDLTVPLVLVTLESGAVLPIDGWHRIKRALEDKCESLPCVTLTKKETKLVTL